MDRQEDGQIHTHTHTHTDDVSHRIDFKKRKSILYFVEETNCFFYHIKNITLLLYLTILTNIFSFIEIKTR